MDYIDKIVLWGTGMIGKRIYNNLKFMNITPAYFVDNNAEKYGTYIDTVLICPPDKLGQDKDALVLIACNDRDMSVYRQAVEIGVITENIYSAFKTNAFIAGLAIERNIFDINSCRINKKNVGIDLQNGAALGGVETWSLGQAKKLNSSGYNVGILLGNDNAQIEINNVFDRKHMHNSKDVIEDMKNNLKILIDEGYSTVVSSFAGTNMFANCYYKKINKDIRHIMVIHNDELAYYEVVAYMQRYIDYCIVISSKIKSELIEYGFNTKKIVVINWNIPVDEKERSVNENNPIRIGYAGRITKTQKRLDYLPLILEYLENKGADYIFEMAGIGDYFNELSDYIKENNLNEKVILLGIVDKKQMHDFWRKQDVYFSCSDWEGHSISQCEGIAAGAVPVVTDVSGAEDDISDGITGYIVPVGDWENLAERLLYLCHNRKTIKDMSDAGMKKMRERNNESEKNVLEELCH